MFLKNMCFFLIEETISIFKLYTGSLFKKGYKKKDLDEDDLYEVISKCNSKKCGDKLEKLWQSYQERNIKPSIYRLLWDGYAKTYLLCGCMEAIWKMTKSIMEPDAVSNLVGYFNHGQTAITKTDAYYYASLVLFFNIAESMFYHNYDLVLFTIGFEAKTGFSSFLYRKSLKLSPDAVSKISLGNFVTLITKDVHAFVSFIFVVNDMWIGAVQSLLICYLIYAKIGAVSLIGVAVLISTIPGGLLLGRWIKKLRLETSAKTDERLQITQEVFSIIRIIKMFTWEDYFIRKINSARIEEMKKTLSAFYLDYVLVAIGLLSSRIGLYVFLMAYIWMGNSSDTSLVFYILSHFKEMRQFFGAMLPRAISLKSQLSASLTRIEKVFHAEELPTKTERFEPNDSSLLHLERATIRLEKRYVLKNITLDVKPGLTVVTGPLACGKSSLLKVFLKDYPLTEGELVTSGRVSYASQDPWLFPSSIRQNILFGQDLDETRKEMKKTLIVFYLEYLLIAIGLLFSKIGFYVLLMGYIWMANAPDTSLVFYILSVFGGMGHFFGVLIPYAIMGTTNLSASSARIEKVMCAEELPTKTERVDTTNSSSLQLKRATIRIENKYILRNITLDVEPGLTVITGPLACGKSSLLKVFLRDYPLTEGELVTSGRVSYASQDPWLFPSSIRQNILFGQDLDETRYQDVIRVCALDFDLNLLEKGDETIVNDKGMNLSKGQQARINLARAVYKESEIYLLDDSLSALDPHVKDYIYNACIKSYLKGKICVLVSQSTSHIQNADHLVIMDKGGVQYFGKPQGDVLEKISVEDYDRDSDKVEEDVLNGTHFDVPAKPSRTKVYGEVNKKGHVDYSVYPKYVTFGGGFLLFLINLVLFGITQTGQSYTDKLLTKWVDEKQVVLNMITNFTMEENTTFGEDLYMKDEFKNAELLEKNTFNIYSIMMVVTTVLALVQTYTFLDFSRRASINIHKTMIQNVVHAVMSFFDTNFIGNVLNRFSKDLVNIDERLPFSISTFISYIFSMIGIITLTATVTPIFLLYVAIIAVVLVLSGIIYLPTGRSLKRLEASTRSPMIGHLNATLEGLTTIRAYDAEHILSDEFDKHQDLYTSAHFTSIIGMFACGFFMDLMCSVFQIAVVSRFIFIDTDTSAGNVGLALTQVFMLGNIIQGGVRSVAELENLMTSMERVLEYTSIDLEPVDGTTHQNWPNQGAIKYDDVSLTYNNNEVVLRNLKFRVEPRQKIGIVGRTGAGKSSIISSIFRLYEAEGVISIDGVNTKGLSLKFLRRNLAIIPQDPVIFSGTLRANLDPFREYQDDELWAVLEKVYLRSTITDLNLPITSSCSSFSLGQKQLICLARAILRKSKIVILDEASANMDQDTDVLLQETIRENFKDCTVFNIAHRLQSVLGCDKVLVLERGEIEEFDAPQSLLRNRNGRFYKMVKQAGLLNQFSES